MRKNKLLSLLIFCLSISLFSISLFADALEEGTYVVNSDGSGDFETLHDVIEILETEGINGPVVIKLAAGTYEGPFTLNKIKNASEENTVTITSEGYTPSAIFTRTSTTSGNRQMFVLIGTKYLILENLTFKNVLDTDVWGLNIRARSEFVTVRGCTFVSEAEKRNNGYHIVVVNSANNTYDEGQPAHNLTIEGNSFTDGYSAINIVGQASTYLTGIKILNNKISNTHLNGMRLRYLDAFEISGNVIELDPDGNAESYGIQIWPSKGGFRMMGNRIFKARRYGIQFGYYNYNYGGGDLSHTDTGEMAIVANNMIGGGFTHTSSNAPAGGISAVGGIQNVAFYYNSINTDVEAVQWSRVTAIHITAAGSKDIRLVNNSFAHTGEGADALAFYIADKNSVVEMDYNNYYCNSNKFGWFGSEVGNLATLQALNYTQNRNSIVGNPKYLSQFDLHSYAAQLSGVGRPIAGITVDIDGDDRDATNPCIGADEYTPMFDHDIAVIGLTGNNLTKVGTPETVKVKVRNEGRIWQPQYTLYLMRDTGETLATLEVNEILWQQGDEAEHEMTWVPVAKGIHRLYALVHLEGDENHNNDRYPVGNTFNVMVQDLTELPQPQVSITGNIGDSSAIISWEPIIGANSYKVYASSDPFAENWPLFTTTSNTFANVDMHYEGMLYFRVVASTAQTLLGVDEDDFLKVNVSGEMSK
ncbi:MAG: hypothetical protein WC990_05660 [Sphaerochaetaceae bacterium]